MMYQSKYPFKNFILAILGFVSINLLIPFLRNDEYSAKEGIVIITVTFLILYYVAISALCQISVYENSLEIYYPLRLFKRKFSFNKEDILKIGFDSFRIKKPDRFFVENVAHKRRIYAHLFSKEQIKEIVSELNTNGIQTYFYPYALHSK